jgi:hypothetical protein
VWYGQTNVRAWPTPLTRSWKGRGLPRSRRGPSPEARPGAPGRGVAGFPTSSARPTKSQSRRKIRSVSSGRTPATVAGRWESPRPLVPRTDTDRLYPRIVHSHGRLPPWAEPAPFSVRSRPGPFVRPRPVPAWIHRGSRPIPRDRDVRANLMTSEGNAGLATRATADEKSMRQASTPDRESRATPLHWSIVVPMNSACAPTR